MPIYVYNCLGCRARFDRYLPIAMYQHMVLHECGGVGQKIILPPMVRGDLPAYTSPIDGRLIEGRRARLEDLRRNNCRPYESGEKEYHERERKRENDRFEAVIDETVEREVAVMPARKRELLEQEVRAGATCETVRLGE